MSRKSFLGEFEQMVNADHENDRGHAIISRLVADRYWPGENALGRASAVDPIESMRME